MLFREGGWVSGYRLRGLPIGGDRVYVSAGEEVYKIKKKSLFKRDLNMYPVSTTTTTTTHKSGTNEFEINIKTRDGSRVRLRTKHERKNILNTVVYYSPPLPSLASSSALIEKVGMADEEPPRSIPPPPSKRRPVCDRSAAYAGASESDVGANPLPPPPWCWCSCDVYFRGGVAVWRST